jgi:hypothetical protein
MPAACHNVQKNWKITSIHNIEMLISETHFTEKSYQKFPNSTTYHMNHSVGTGLGGAGIIKLQQASSTKQL